jgi:hypothetical protein
LTAAVVKERLRGLLGNLGLAAASLALLLGAVEALARLAAGGAFGRGGDQVLRPISRFHPALGWDKVPGGEALIRRPEFEITLSINSLGLRGPERPHARPAGVRRALLLGDSFAEGYYVEEEATARALLERALNVGACAGWEVLNGGTIAYSTDQEYLFYREEGHRYGAEVVLLLFYHNDLWYNARSRGPGGEAKPFFAVEEGRLVQRNGPLQPDASGGPNRQNPGSSPLRPWRGSVALRLLSNRTADAAPRLHRRLAALGLVEPLGVDPPREFAPYGPGLRREVTAMWDVTRALLGALHEEVGRRGGRLAVLYVPARFEVNEAVWEITRARYRLGRRWDPYAVFDRLDAILKGLGVPLLDPRDSLRRAEAGPRPAYYTRDVHWTDVGNALAAAEMQRFVEATACGTPASRAAPE